MFYFITNYVAHTYVYGNFPEFAYTTVLTNMTD